MVAANVMLTRLVGHLIIPVAGRLLVGQRTGRTVKNFLEFMMASVGMGIAISRRKSFKERTWPRLCSAPGLTWCQALFITRWPELAERLAGKENLGGPLAGLASLERTAMTSSWRRTMPSSGRRRLSVWIFGARRVAQSTNKCTSTSRPPPSGARPLSSSASPGGGSPQSRRAGAGTPLRPTMWGRGRRTQRRRAAAERGRRTQWGFPNSRGVG